MRKLLSMAILASCIFALPLFSHGEPFFSVYIGGVIPHEADVKDNKVSGTGQMDFAPGVTFGAKGGQWLNDYDLPFLGFLIDLNGHFPDGDSLSASGVVGELEADLAVYSVTINGALRPPYLRPPYGAFRPYAGVGIGWFFGDIDNGTISQPVLSVPAAFKGEDDSAFGWQFFGGMEWVANPKASVFFEYKYTRTNLEFGGDVGLDIDYEASHAYIGITFRFD